MPDYINTADGKSSDTLPVGVNLGENANGI